jgi:hypothetical protein
MIQWHSDGAQAYRDFEESNLEDGGVLKQGMFGSVCYYITNDMKAADEGLISIPFHHLVCSVVSHDGWNAKIRPGDVLNLSYFLTKSHIGM